jgi:hypothetical protein
VLDIRKPYHINSDKAQGHSFPRPVTL